MKAHELPYLLFIEPDRPASREPVIDEFTMKMTAALRAGTPPGITCRGVHECVCGATSEAHDYNLPNGMVTNSLCVHYLAHQREEVPQRELDKVETLQCGTAAPSAEELRGGPALPRLSPPRRPVPRRDDGPLPTPLLVDVERDLWRAGLRDWDDDGPEFRVDGETFAGLRAAWLRSREMIAEWRASRAPREQPRRPG